MIFSHLFRVLDEKEASEKRSNSGQPVATDEARFASASSARTRERSGSLQVQQLKSHLATTQPVVAEIPPRARVHKQTIQKTRKTDATRSSGFFGGRALCEDVALCPASQKVLPPIRSSADSSAVGQDLSGALAGSSQGHRLGKLPPIESVRSKTRNEKTRWQAITGSFTSAKGREEGGNCHDTAKLFESGRAAIQGLHGNDTLRRMSQPAWLQGRITAQPATLGDTSVLYYHDDNQNLLSDPGRSVSLAPSHIAREQRTQTEEFWREVHDAKEKNCMSTKGGNTIDDRKESQFFQQSESSGMANETHREHCTLKRVNFVPTSPACMNQTPFSCKFNTTQRTNIGNPAAQQPAAPAWEALYANLIVSENRRRNAICEALEQNECEDHGWSLFEQRQVLANSFA